MNTLSIMSKDLKIGYLGLKMPSDINKIKVARTIKAGHPHIKKIVDQTEFNGQLVAVRYYKNTETGETWKTFEVRPHNKPVKRNG